MVASLKDGALIAKILYQKLLIFLRPNNGQTPFTAFG
jgi:hypothetical protein